MAAVRKEGQSHRRRIVGTHTFTQTLTLTRSAPTAKIRMTKGGDWGEEATSFAERSSELTMTSCEGALIAQTVKIVLFLFYGESDTRSIEKKNKS